MIPLRSSEPVYSRPIVTLVLIVVNLLIFLFEWSMQPYNLESVIFHYGIVPARFHFTTLFTSMFLHGGFLHVIGNMWFLWVFGRAIEDLLGHGEFLLFYLASGVAAGLVHLAFNAGSAVPTVGASGAIAGVMGAYLVKFPRAHIVTLVPIFLFLTTFDIPAAFLLIYWFVIQFFSGFGSLGASNTGNSNIAFVAHVGGFLAGMALILILPTRPRYRAWR
jgi:membrane associated rhomboid family serine protease